MSHAELKKREMIYVCSWLLRSLRSAHFWLYWNRNCQLHKVKEFALEYGYGGAWEYLFMNFLVSKCWHEISEWVSWSMLKLEKDEKKVSHRKLCLCFLQKVSVLSHSQRLLCLKGCACPSLVIMM